MKPKIIIDSAEGRHNLTNRAEALKKAKTYQDLSTVCIVPTRGVIAARVVQNWMGLITPMNQKFIRLFIVGAEVGSAYESAIDNVIHHPELKHWKYILTLEEDNMPPADGLLKLYESMDEYDVVGGLYWTKGEGGQPMIYGNPEVRPKNFIPQVPLPNTVQRANGLGMGFNLFKMDIFKDKKLTRPWFKTMQEMVPNKGMRLATQDLYFYEKAGKLGYKFACDTRVKVGHYDITKDIVW